MSSFSQQKAAQRGILTPPITPDKVSERAMTRLSNGEDSESSIRNPPHDLTSLLAVVIGLGLDPRGAVEDMLRKNVDVGPLQFVPELPRPYHGSYTLSKRIIGYGAWSKVFSATTKSGSALLTPPNTPPRAGSASGAQLLAVKRLDRRDGRAVLEKEARILTYLHSHHRASDYLVPFHGFDADTTSIVMDMIPLTLEDHVRTKAALPVRTATMFDPVIGGCEWADLALDLISGLEYIHSKKCVHGDIKPSNVLLHATTDTRGITSIKPLYCDFSSSHVELDSSSLVDEVSAVTPDYAAPELLRALNPCRRSSETDRAITTFKSDIFALAVTLLVAGTGQSPYAQAQLQIQRNVMAEEGLPLAYAQSSDQAARVRPGDMIDRVLRAGTYRDPQKRLLARDWLAHARGIIEVETSTR